MALCSPTAPMAKSTVSWRPLTFMLRHTLCSALVHRLVRRNLKTQSLKHTQKGLCILYYSKFYLFSRTSSSYNPKCQLHSICVNQENNRRFVYVDSGEVLDEVVRRVCPQRVLELGMHCGYSSVRLLRLLPPAGKLITVELDPFTADLGEEIILVAGFKHSQVH